MQKYKGDMVSTDNNIDKQENTFKHKISKTT